MKFTGHERDADTGMDYMHARFYTSHLGRFMSPDVILGDVGGRGGSWNRYQYGLGNPIRMFDPNGLDEQCWEDIQDDVVVATGCTSTSDDGITDWTDVTGQEWSEDEGPKTSYFGNGRGFELNQAQGNEFCDELLDSMCDGDFEVADAPKKTLPEDKLKRSKRKAPDPCKNPGSEALPQCAGNTDSETNPPEKRDLCETCKNWEQVEWVRVFNMYCRCGFVCMDGGIIHNGRIKPDRWENGIVYAGNDIESGGGCNCGGVCK